MTPKRKIVWDTWPVVVLVVGLLMAAYIIRTLPPRGDSALGDLWVPAIGIAGGLFGLFFVGPRMRS